MVPILPPEADATESASRSGLREGQPAPQVAPHALSTGRCRVKLANRARQAALAGYGTAPSWLRGRPLHLSELVSDPAQVVQSIRVAFVRAARLRGGG